jgi:hypothetical protein
MVIETLESMSRKETLYAERNMTFGLMPGHLGKHTMQIKPDERPP